MQKKAQHRNDWPTDREFEPNLDWQTSKATGKHRKITLIEATPGLMPDPASNVVRELVMPL
jgi:hypothetical protein